MARSIRIDPDLEVGAITGRGHEGRIVLHGYQRKIARLVLRSVGHSEDAGALLGVGREQRVRGEGGVNRILGLTGRAHDYVTRVVSVDDGLAVAGAAERDSFVK